MTTFLRWYFALWTLCVVLACIAIHIGGSKIIGFSCLFLALSLLVGGEIRLHHILKRL